MAGGWWPGQPVPGFLVVHNAQQAQRSSCQKLFSKPGETGVEADSGCGWEIQPACLKGAVLPLRLDLAQGVGGGKDRDALIGTEIEQVEIAGDDEIGACCQRAGEHVIIIGIAAGRCR